MPGRRRQPAEKSSCVLRRNALAPGVGDDGHRIGTVWGDCRADPVAPPPLARAAAVGIFFAIEEQQREPLLDLLDVEHHRQRAKRRPARIDTVAKRARAGPGPERVEDGLAEVLAAVVVADQHRQHEIAARRDEVGAQRIVAAHHPRQDRLDRVHHRDGLKDTATDRSRIIAAQQQAGSDVVIDLPFAAAIGEELRVEHRNRDDPRDRA